MFIFNYKAHIFISLALLTSFLNILNIDTKLYLLLLSGCIFGSILPDCDLRYSVAGIIFPLWIIFEYKARKKIRKDDYIISQNTEKNKYCLIVHDVFIEEYDSFLKAKEKRDKLIEKDISFFYHRTYTHSLIGITILLLIYIFLNLIFFNKLSSRLTSIVIYLNISIMGLIIGYILHIVVDSFNKTGIRFFYGFDDKSYGFKLFKSGGNTEKVLSAISIGVLIFMLGTKFNLIKYLNYILQFTIRS